MQRTLIKFIFRCSFGWIKMTSLASWALMNVSQTYCDVFAVCKDSRLQGDISPWWTGQEVIIITNTSWLYLQYESLEVSGSLGLSLTNNKTKQNCRNVFIFFWIFSFYRCRYFFSLCFKPKKILVKMFSLEKKSVVCRNSFSFFFVSMRFPKWKKYLFIGFKHEKKIQWNVFY